MMQRIRHLFYKGLLICLLTFPLYSLSLESLQKGLSLSDIQATMKPMLDEHYGAQKMTPDLLAHAMENYIHLLDPEQLYFLENEVDEYLHPTPPQKQAFLTSYEDHSFHTFLQINDLFTHAIERSRRLRSWNTSEVATLVDLAAKGKASTLTLSFASSEEELAAKNKNRFIFYLQEEMSHFGEERVRLEQQRVYERYLKQQVNYEKHYLDDSDENFITTNILKALAQSLDAHTTFFNEEEAEEMKAHLSKHMLGIGVQLQDDLLGVRIAGLRKGAPADRTGVIHVGDYLSTINGVDVESSSLEEIHALLVSDKPKQFLLTFKRESSPNHVETIAVTVTSEEIEILTDRVDSSFDAVPGGIIGHLTLHSFYEGDHNISSVRDLQAAIQELQTKGTLKGVILDLRENGGGYLTQAVKVAGLFISNGVIVISKYQDGEQDIYRDVDTRTVFDGPLIVLTSKLTASAAEIVAQALKDYGVAIIVGDVHTYGKGSIQAQTLTESGSKTYFKVTIGRYYTVSGTTPQLKGVQADIVVPSKYSKLLIGEQGDGNDRLSNSLPPYFLDTLSDIPSRDKEWYVKYYLPTLQKRQFFWKEHLPYLRERSAARLKEEISNEPNSTSADQDPQLTETKAILMDMIKLKAGG